ncbi:Vacuolar protein sorting-associated protein 18 homolog [Eumeta japonica]|uniref:Vacuolar protein sorting-associated protein 18 homolog n=1 Tax=Eumeta variegata TaxID=151549 RepID=A0A4C2AHD2_EUMVA|nr:Vacuolar protein sorting-associated protein 18 homolog [Eumeta japonica]
MDDADDIYNNFNIPLAKPKFLEPVANNEKTSSNSGEDETPIFSKRKITLHIPQQYSGEFMHLTVCKNWLVCLLQASEPSTQVILLRFFLPRHTTGRRIEKFKDHEITAVAFNKDYGTESSTGPILLGTSKGLIFETELNLDAEKPSYRKQVYDLGLGRPKYPITGLEFNKLPNTSQYILIITAPDCILHSKNLCE